MVTDPLRFPYRSRADDEQAGSNPKGRVADHPRGIAWCSDIQEESRGVLKPNRPFAHTSIDRALIVPLARQVGSGEP